MPGKANRRRRRRVRQGPARRVREILDQEREWVAGFFSVGIRSVADAVKFADLQLADLVKNVRTHAEHMKRQRYVDVLLIHPVHYSRAMAIEDDEQRLVYLATHGVHLRVPVAPGEMLGGWMAQGVRVLPTVHVPAKGVQ